MKTFLQNLLIFFALSLCALIAVQWVRENKSQRTIQNLTDTIHDKSELIQNLQLSVKRDEAEIQRLDGLKNQLTETVKSNNVEIAQLGRDLKKTQLENEKNAKELEVYKDALKVANENVIKEGEDIKTLNTDLKNLLGQHNGLVTNLNVMTKSINDMATKWSRMGDDMQKLSASAQREAAVTNMSTMAKDFNAFAQNWNHMQQELAGHSASTNAPAGNR
jgi:chromosome segregation ATPase